MLNQVTTTTTTTSRALDTFGGECDRSFCNNRGLCILVSGLFKCFCIDGI